MADGFPITPGSGGTAATDDAGAAGHVQIVKLAISADGSATVLPGDAANGLDVDVTRSALPTGAATSANQSSELTLVGAVNETAPATDTASSGLNGRLQRIAQRLTSLIAQIPAALGQATMANSLAVTIASNQSAVSVSVTAPASATVAQVGAATSSTTLQASNAARRGLKIQNDSTAVLYVKYGSTASATSYTVKMLAGDYWEMPASDYSGIVTGIWVSVNGNAYVTET